MFVEMFTVEGNFRCEKMKLLPTRAFLYIENGFVILGNYNLNALNGFILTVIGNLKYENFKTFKMRILEQIYRVILISIIS